MTSSRWAGSSCFLVKSAASRSVKRKLVEISGKIITSSSTPFWTWKTRSPNARYVPSSGEVTSLCIGSYWNIAIRLLHNFRRIDLELCHQTECIIEIWL